MKHQQAPRPTGSRTTAPTTPASVAPWQITDDALATLDRELATPAPERGAALLAPADSRMVVEVIVDPVPGESASYWHSPRLEALLNDRLARQPLLRYVGTAHSHPRQMAWPSAPDHLAFDASLRAAGIDAGLFPIVVSSAPQELRIPSEYGVDHLVPVAHGTVAPYSWHGGRGLAPARVAVMPLRGSIEGATALLREEMELRMEPAVPVAGVGTTWLLVALRGEPTTACPVRTPVSVDLLVPQSYPESAPLIRVGGGGFAAPAWNLATDLSTRLADAIRSAVTCAGDTGATSVAIDARSGIAARLGHHIPSGSATVSKRVAILGCGSVGSCIAELLVRGGVEEFVLVDPDDVSTANLSRGIYVAGDVGRPKVEALAARLTAIAPHVATVGHHAGLGDDAATALAGVDLAVLATDDPAAEAWHSHVLYDAGIPYVSTKLFAKADAGEIAFVVPDRSTACLACATGFTVGQGGRGEVDYGTGRLDGEPALGADIAAVSARATKAALAVLHRDAPGPLADWIRPLLAAGRTLNLSASVDGWGVFQQIAAAPMDGPFASVWVKTTPRPDCAVCGTVRDTPVHPLAGAQLPADLDTLLDGASELVDSDLADAGIGTAAEVS
ncbi:ThiF family adenylyltransferase [Nocardioides sp. LHD-245]|uniref:HesA/MoeB/ThiF family protein n=1 Tax=Nocardioides sp. LHD-245 TaxID=3051387 RepID=UPI0027DF1BB2|nr:ThiF family adenylyltransferase [Nocardioides sp. LHD-245]